MTRQHWRDRLPVHPAAELLPLMSKDELRELADDIKKGGLQERVKYVYDEDNKVHRLLDGRNRLDALELLGRDLFPGEEDSPGDRDYPEWFAGDREIFDEEYCDDPVAFVVSANIRRRHLTSDQKGDLIAKLLELDPEKSDRQVAAMVKVDHKTVAKKRRKKEARGEIPHVAKRTDTKGRRQPAAKTIKVKVTRSTIPIVAPFTVVESGEPPKVVNLTVTPEDSAEQRKRVNGALEAVPDGPEQPQQEDNTAFDHQSRHALAEFKYACKAYLPKMNAAHRQEAVDEVAAIAAKIGRATP